MKAITFHGVSDVRAETWRIRRSWTRPTSSCGSRRARCAARTCTSTTAAVAARSCRRAPSWATSSWAWWRRPAPPCARCAPAIASCCRSTSRAAPASGAGASCRRSAHHRPRRVRRTLRPRVGRGPGRARARAVRRSPVREGRCGAVRRRRAVPRRHPVDRVLLRGERRHPAGRHRRGLRRRPRRPAGDAVRAALRAGARVRRRPRRLSPELADEFGAEPVNLDRGDPAEQLRTLTGPRAGRGARVRRPRDAVHAGDPGGAAGGHRVVGRRVRRALDAVSRRARRSSRTSR